ncbi:hypothetical protein EX895_004248 [Sporisorium graminicola]|uniref:HMG box domain-containing protein n=1 Tax=Sporisorium graminicola TaxID=280036 RepID=A0A4V6EV80_9BASI|nr:hypothetical protein EX895_004248 [Sporisorium graminicola]TKY86609.1 hypothetical protein EX895_004248 [Sporisorium graminicola]
MDSAISQHVGKKGAGPLTSIRLSSTESRSHISTVTPTVLRKIPRPPNAFILYRSNKMRELKNQKNPQGLSDTGLDKLDYQRQLSKVIGQLWRDETAEVKAAFYEKAQQAALEHRQRYPEYRYQPSVKKAASREHETHAITASSAASGAPERLDDTDVSPGDLSGPLSGSGSGSGRKRASLEGARSKGSPYSTSRHRRTSSAGTSSPTAQQTSSNLSRQRAHVLLHAAGATAGQSSASVPLTRSKSFGASSQRSNQRRSAKPSTRRSLDGRVSQIATTSTSFDTLVPQRLRDTRVFLAPHTPPALPIGQAITTNESGTGHEDQGHQEHLHKPKSTLFDAVRSALPPERRAFLQEALAMKGYARALPNPITNRSVATNPQSDRWTSANSTFPSHTWQSQGMASNPPSQSSYSTAQHELSSNLDPANQAPLGPNLNLLIRASSGANYADLADWSQPDPCWLSNSQTQTPSSGDAAPLKTIVHEAYTGQTGGERLSPQWTSVYVGPQLHCAQPLASFEPIDISQCVPADYEINHSNSAFVELSEPDSSGQVQGHFYGLNGQLVGQGRVDGTELGSNVVQEYLDEEARQRRVVDQLLMQMMTSGTSSNSLLGCTLHPYLVDEGATHLQGGSQDPASSTYGRAQWQSWSQDAAVEPEGMVDQSGSQSSMVATGSHVVDAHVFHDGFQPAAFEPQVPSMMPHREARRRLLLRTRLCKNNIKQIQQPLIHFS